LNNTVAALLLPENMRYHGAQGPCIPSRVRNQRIEDKEIVLAAVTQNGTALKFAKPPLKQEEEVMKAAGIFGV